MTHISVRTYLRSVLDNNSVEDILSSERRAVWETFTNDDKKEFRESAVFVRFARSIGLSIDVIEHKNNKPPFPDIHSTVNGRPYYFELGEIVDEALARRESISERTGESTGGPFSQEEPLLRMFREKCEKTYRTNGVPVDLLLYYFKQYPHKGVLLDYLRRRRLEISTHIANGPYARIWIYSDWNSGEILWKAGTA